MYAEVVQEVGLLVYDEIHYLRDKERGVVWEESIILAPKGEPGQHTSCCCSIIPTDSDAV
jgi:hypothetical protein